MMKREAWKLLKQFLVMTCAVLLTLVGLATISPHQYQSAALGTLTNYCDLSIPTVWKYPQVLLALNLCVQDLH
jgi:hypothetical protein